MPIAFEECALCRALPEGHGVLSAPDGARDREEELDVVCASSRASVLSCPACGTLYHRVETPVDVGFWTAFVDDDVPDEPHVSLVRADPISASGRA